VKRVGGGKTNHGGLGKEVAPIWAGVGPLSCFLWTPSAWENLLREGGGKEKVKLGYERGSFKK